MCHNLGIGTKFCSDVLRIGCFSFHFLGWSWGTWSWNLLHASTSRGLQALRCAVIQMAADSTARYEGEWLDGVRHGKGLLLSHGRTMDIVYKNGHVVEQTPAAVPLDIGAGAGVTVPWGPSVRSERRFRPCSVALPPSARANPLAWTQQPRAPFQGNWMLLLAWEHHSGRNIASPKLEGQFTNFCNGGTPLPRLQAGW